MADELPVTIAEPPAPASGTAGDDVPRQPFGPAPRAAAELPRDPIGSDVRAFLAEELEPTVRANLGVAGALVGGLLGLSPLADPDVPDHWQFMPEELDDLAGPVARILARRPAAAAAVAEHGDEFTVGAVMLGYGLRNVVAGTIARNARAELEGHHDHGNLDGEAGSSAPPGDGGARGGAGGQHPGWTPAPPGTGVHPPSA